MIRPLESPRRWLKERTLSVRAIVATSAVNVVSAVLGSLGGLFLARLLAPHDRGRLALVLIWPTFVGAAAGLGLPQATCYWVARREPFSREIVGTATVISLILTAMVGSVGAGLSAVLVSDSLIRFNMALLFLLLPLYVIPGIWVSSLQALDVRRWNLSRLTQPVVYVAGILLLAALGGVSIQTAVVVYLISLTTQLVVSGALLFRIWTGPKSPRVTSARQLMAYGVKTSASNAPWLLNARVDQLVLSLFVSPAALANYVLAVSLSQIVGPISTAFGSVAFPRLARQGEGRRNVQREALIGSALTALTILVPVVALAPYGVPRLFGDGYSQATVLLLILAPGALIFVTNQVSGDIFRGYGLPLVPAVAELVGLALTAVLMLILIPQMGVVGAAVASVLSYLATGCVLFFKRKNLRDEGDRNRFKPEDTSANASEPFSSLGEQ